METQPLNKDLYNKCLELNIKSFTLHFSGGNDEGFLDVSIQFDKRSAEKDSYFELQSDIEDWAWDVYSYSGAGDGRTYGDDITYDIQDKSVTCEGWYTREIRTKLSESFNFLDVEG